MPQLIVPKHLAKGKPNARPLFGSKDFWPKFVQPNAYGMKEASTRKVSVLPGSYIEDMVQLRKSIVLCCACASKFYYKRAKFYKDGVYGPCVVDRCDGCRSYTNRGQLYLPEERLADPSGAKPGQVWTPA